MLTPREIIAHSWAITTTEPALKRWGFIGALFEILLDMKLLIYQVYFLYSYFKGEGGGLFDIEIMLYRSIPFSLFLTLVIGFIVLVIIELFVPSLADGAIIGLSAKAHNKEKLQGGFIMGLYNFFPILEVHGIFIFSSLSIFVTAISVILRYGAGLQGIMIVIATVIWIVSNIMKFFSSFIEPGIVIDKLGVFAGGSRSIKLIMSYMPHVMFLAMLLMVITIRIIVNTVIILLVPAIVFGIGIALTHAVQPGVAYTIAAVIGIILTVISAYFLAYLHVFKQTVWTVMYMELKKEKEMDKIG